MSGRWFDGDLDDELPPGRVVEEPAGARPGDVSNAPDGQVGWVRLEGMTPGERETLIRGVCTVEGCERCAREVFATWDRTAHPERVMLDLDLSTRWGQWFAHDLTACETGRLAVERRAES